MTQVDAIYQNGVFKPLQEVKLPENQRVRLSVQPTDVEAWRAWFADVQEFKQRMFAEHGYFPDSTLDIAEDRQR